MEKEGLHRCLSFLKEHDLDVEVLVTDRHKQINKWLREKHSDVKHYYDIWHVAKGIPIAKWSSYDHPYLVCLYTGFRKKLEKLGKQKGCELVCEWQKSIINHLYWCVSSSSNDDNDDNSELVKAKWLSLDNHVHNVHKSTVKSFLNVSTEDFEAGIKRKNGLKDVSGIYLYKHVIVLFIVDTKASEKLTPLLLNSNHLKDITRLSSSYQTSSLESFHNIVIHFAPKSIAFSYMGMKSR